MAPGSAETFCDIAETSDNGRVVPAFDRAFGGHRDRAEQTDFPDGRRASRKGGDSLVLSL